MLFFFRLNQPLAIPLLFLYAALVNAVPLYHSFQDSGPSLSASLAQGDRGVSWLWAYLSAPDRDGPQPVSERESDPRAIGGDHLAPHPVVFFGGVLLVVLQALLINSSLRSIKGLIALGYLPALFYLFFAAVVGAGLDAPTLGAGFLLLAFNRLLRAYGPEPADALLLEAGFWTGVAALVVPLYGIFLPFSILMAANLRPFNLREALVVFAGFTAVFLLALASLYVMDWEREVLAQSFQFEWYLPRLRGLETPVLLSTVVPVGVALAGLVLADQRNRKSLIQVRKLSSWTGWFGLAAGLAWGFGVVVAAAAVFPMAFFTAYWAQGSSWPRTWEFFHLTLLGLLLAGRWMGST